MKRLIFPIALILMAAMVLSACSAGGTTVNNETPGVPQTGETSVAGTPTSEATTAMTEQATGTGAGTSVDTSTPSAGSGTSTSSSVGTATPSTGTGTSTSTGGMTGTSTPSTGTGTSTATTPSAGNTSVPGTGATESYVRLSTLLNGTVTASDGTNVGTATGVLVQHPVIPAAADTSATPAASPTVAPTMTAEEMAFTVRYVLVDVSTGASNSSSSGNAGSAGNGGRLVIVPWQAFDFGTVTAGSAKLNVAGSAVTGAPHFSLPDVASSTGAWFGQMDSYWAGQSVNGYKTSTAKSLGEANLSLVSHDFRDMAVTGPNGEDFGQVSDLLIDPITGQVLYAVFSGGAALNNQVFVIPLNLLNWTAATSGTQLGSFAVNIPLDTLKNSPVFQSLQNLTLDPNTVQQLQNFWNSVVPSK
jgi:hypothetical protein